MQGIREMFEVVYQDILKQWTSCWKEALIAGFVFMVGNRQIDRLSDRHNGVDGLFFADGVFLYFLLYVTLFSRSIGSRQEVAFLPFSGDEVAGGNYYYLIENFLLFIPFGFLSGVTLCIYGKMCSIKKIVWLAFLTSVSIEMSQYVFSCGKTETDDVIANVFGAFVGGLIARLVKCDKAAI